jgi:hypothetical protein
MKIRYVENKNGKLFSFYRHDFKEDIDEEQEYIFIDGGFDYTRCQGELKEADIYDLMPEIREKFIWGQNYDEFENRLPKTIYKPLKDLSSSHIAGILRYFTELLANKASDLVITATNQWIAVHLIFIYELENRLKNDWNK